MTEATTATAAVDTRRPTVAAAIGTFVEYYDFVVYAYFAPVLAGLFFPTSDPTVSLMLSFGAFAMSYAVRPVGALIFGPLGDKFGRQKILAAVILLTSAATTMIGLLPTYAQIGLAAPVLLTLARLVQGLAVGGEFGGATTYIAEYASPNRRGFHLSWLGVAVGLGLLAGSLGAVITTRTLDSEVLTSWAWRVPFLLALPLGLIGVYLRTRLSDTPEFIAAAQQGDLTLAAAGRNFGRDLPRVLFAAGALAAMTAGVYVFLLVMPSYLSRVLGYTASDAQTANAIGIVAFCVTMPFFGLLSDRVGATRLVVISTLLLGAFSYPALLVMDGGGLGATVIVLTFMGTLAAMGFASALAAIPELFGVRSRYTSLGLGWNISAVAFGGAAPVIITSLTANTGDHLAPAYFVMIGCACTLLAYLVRRRLVT